MEEERSAGVMVFRKTKEVLYYLLLHYQSGHWDFIKGNIEEGEALKKTVRRETEEETGIKDIEFVEGYKEKIEYLYQREGKKIYKTVIFFLAETETKEIKTSYEHQGFKWLPYEEALDKLTFKNAKEVLKKANKLILKLKR